MSKVLLIIGDINNKRYKTHCSNHYDFVINQIKDLSIVEEIHRIDVVILNTRVENIEEINDYFLSFNEIQREKLNEINFISSQKIETLNIHSNINYSNINYLDEKEWFKKFIEIDISTSEELFLLMSSSSESQLEKIYTLTSDINMEDFVCLSIGSIDKPFNGKFNGNSKTIIINKIGENFSGLFGCIKENCSVENINLELNITDYSVNNYSSSAGLCGRNDKGSISNCMIKFNQHLNFNNISSEVNYTAGICGYNTGIINHCSIGFTGLTINTHFNFGNICGYNSGVVNNTNVYINKECKVYLGRDKYSNMGFLVGINDKKDSIITNCMAAFNNISIMNADSSFNIGGVVGYNYFGLINGCNILFNGDFEIENENSLGGIAYTNNGNIMNSSCIFKKCKSIKSIINNPGKILDVNVLIYNDTVDTTKIEEQNIDVPLKVKSVKEVNGTDWFWIILLIILTILIISIFFIYLYCDCYNIFSTKYPKNIKLII